MKISQPRFLILFILLLAAGLYIYQINAEGLWIDELTSIDDVKKGGIPPQRPLYYVFLWGWMAFGESDAWLRALSIPFSLGSIFLTYQLGRRLLGEAEGLIAGLLLALSPLFLNHTQEVRMYTMSTCLGVAGALVLSYALTNRASKLPTNTLVGSWAILRLLALLAMPLNATLLATDVVLIGVTFYKQRQTLLKFGIGLILIALMWLPFVVSVAGSAMPSSEYAQAGHVAKRKPPGLDQIVRFIKFFTIWPFEVQTNKVAAGFYKLFTAVLCGVLGAALIRKRPSSGFLWVAAWALLPTAQILVFSYLSIPLWVERYLVFLCPYLFLLLAAGLTRLWSQWRIAAIAISIAYLVAVSGGLVRYYTVQDRPDYKFIIQTIQVNEQPGDAIAWSLYYSKALNHYYKGAAEIYTQPTLSGDMEAETIQSWLESLPPNQSRLWLATDISNKDYPSFQSALTERFNIQEHFTYERESDLLLLTYR